MKRAKTMRSQQNVCTLQMCDHNRARYPVSAARSCKFFSPHALALQRASNAHCCALLQCTCVRCRGTFVATYLFAIVRLVCDRRSYTSEWV